MKIISNNKSIFSKGYWGSIILLLIASVLTYHSIQFNFDGASYTFAVSRFDFAGFGGHIVYFYLNWAIYKGLSIFNVLPHQSLSITSFFTALLFVLSIKQYFHIFNKRISLTLITVLSLTSPLFVYFLQEFDVLMLAALFLSYSLIFFEKGLSENKKHLKLWSAFFYVLAFFTHTNTVFFGIYFAVQLFKKRITITDALILATVGLFTAILLLIYPVTAFGNISTVIEWVFMSPVYYVKDILKNIALVTVLFGPLFLGILMSKKVKHIIKNDLELILPFIVFIGVYSCTKTNGFYIDSILSWFPIVLILYLKYPLFLNYKKLLIISSAIVITINIFIFRYIFTIKSDIVSNSIHFIEKNIKENAYLEYSVLSPYIQYHSQKHTMINLNVLDCEFKITPKMVDKFSTEIVPKACSDLDRPLYTVQPYKGFNETNKSFKLVDTLEKDYDLILWEIIKRPQSWVKKIELYKYVSSDRP
jgi:hypothetical protein